jgi:protein TonB
MSLAALAGMHLRFLFVSALLHVTLVVGTGIWFHVSATRNPIAALSIEILPPMPTSGLPEPMRDDVEVPVESPSEDGVELQDPDLPFPTEELEVEEPRRTPLAESLWRDMPLIRLRPLPEPPEDFEKTEETGQPTEAIPYVEATLLPGNNSPPDYPYRARKLRQEGAVVTRISVDRTGAVTDVLLVEECPYEMLNEAVLYAVREWRFDPALRDGVPVATTIVQKFRFILARMARF